MSFSQVSTWLEPIRAMVASMVLSSNQREILTLHLVSIRM